MAEFTFQPGKFSPAIVILPFENFDPLEEDEEYIVPKEYIPVSSASGYPDVTIAYTVGTTVCGSEIVDPDTQVDVFDSRGFLGLSSNKLSTTWECKASRLMSCPCFLHSHKILSVDLGDDLLVKAFLNGHNCGSCRYCQFCEESLDHGSSSIKITPLSLFPSGNFKLPKARWFPSLTRFPGSILVGNVKRPTSWIENHTSEGPQYDHTFASVLVSPNKRKRIWGSTSGAKLDNPPSKSKEKGNSNSFVR